MVGTPGAAPDPRIHEFIQGSAGGLPGAAVFLPGGSGTGGEALLLSIAYAEVSIPWRAFVPARCHAWIMLLTRTGPGNRSAITRIASHAFPECLKACTPISGMQRALTLSHEGQLCAGCGGRKNFEMS
jgi:hypothetical protein